ncbi:MAG TPA: DUF305 domain-containing protein [Gammaproteobacteria bacterium]
MRRERRGLRRWLTAIVRLSAVCTLTALSVAAANEPAAALYDEEDLLFLRHMIDHHEQAVVLSALVPERTGRAELVRFADYIARAQAAEIAVMQSLLDAAEARGLHPAHADHEAAQMPGMLARGQIDELAAASGAEFERRWLEGMIFHHEGALTMADAQQRRQFREGRRPYGIDVLLDEILVEQRAEIAKMRAWLDEWGLAPSEQAPR